ncbi:internal virion protein B [uncultured Caudovirales phage]|uniref:Internal virion protein B n=1 Tax=uncultured Caudovirales phage TaxID=2100421 RepID=A0A6J7W6P7_9CAUD|nr:internal virion protein B [uncultured Caudovirales phage]
MCLMMAPALMAGLSLVSGIGSAVVGFMGQQQAYDAQKAQWKENIKNAQETARTQYAHDQNHIIQERNAASLEKQNANIEVVQAASTAEAAASEGGVQGSSVNQFLASYYGKQGRYNDTVDANYQMKRDYVYANMDQTKNQTQSQINSMAKPIKPSFLDAAIRIAGAGLSAASSYNSNMGYA